MAEDQRAQFEHNRMVDDKVFDAPKRPGNCFNLYIVDGVRAMKEKFPTKNQTDILILVAAQWKKMSDSEKSKYSEKGKSLWEEYKRLLAEYNQKGYYTSCSSGKSTGKIKQFPLNLDYGKDKRGKIKVIDKE